MTDNYKVNLKFAMTRLQYARLLVMLKRSTMMNDKMIYK